MRRRWSLIAGTALVVAAAACGGGETTTTDPAGPGTTDTQPGSTAASTTTTEASGMDESPIAEATGFGSMTILTPSDGGGDRPELAWEPVDGAAYYKITLLAPDGSFYWGWTGSEAAVPVGGFPALTPAAAGPRLVSGMSWTVIAYGPDDRLLAIGGPVPISP